MRRRDGDEVVEFLPISVKTRLGYTKTDEMEGWVTTLLSSGIAALTMHARTKQEMSKVPAHWEKIAELVKIRDEIARSRVISHASRDDEAISNSDTGLLRPQGKIDVRARNFKTLIIGNGDIKTYQEGLDKIAQTGCDGVMVGRGAFGSPWFFKNNQPSIKERLTIMLEHAELFNQKLGNLKPFLIMRKHFKAYASGFAGAHELRAKLMETKNLEEVKEIVTEYLRSN
jgi:tRNA-dihydrouridine synthase